MGIVSLETRSILRVLLSESLTTLEESPSTEREEMRREEEMTGEMIGEMIIEEMIFDETTA